jgi:hypothetical protein
MTGYRPRHRPVWQVGGFSILTSCRGLDSRGLGEMVVFCRVSRDFAQRFQKGHDWRESPRTDHQIPKRLFQFGDRNDETTRS